MVVPTASERDKAKHKYFTVVNRDSSPQVLTSNPQQQCIACVVGHIFTDRLYLTRGTLVTIQWNLKSRQVYRSMIRRAPCQVPPSFVR